MHFGGTDIFLDVIILLLGHKRRIFTYRLLQVIHCVVLFREICFENVKDLRDVPRLLRKTVKKKGLLLNKCDQKTYTHSSFQNIQGTPGYSS